MRGINADFFSKDVRILSHIKLKDRDFKDVIIVDNLISNFMLQFHNCIPIKDYTGETEEDIVILKSLTNYLLSLENVENVREKIAQDFYSPLFPVATTPTTPADRAARASLSNPSSSAEHQLSHNPVLNPYAPLLNYARISQLQN